VKTKGRINERKTLSMKHGSELGNAVEADVLEMRGQILAEFGVGETETFEAGQRMLERDGVDGAKQSWEAGEFEVQHPRLDMVRS